MFVKSYAVIALAGVALSASAAHAQFRPGSSPDGGRIRSVCNDERFSRADRKECEKLMREAKTPEQRAEVRKQVQEKLGIIQKDIDKFMDKNSDPLSSTGGGPAR